MLLLHAEVFPLHHGPTDGKLNPTTVTTFLLFFVPTYSPPAASHFHNSGLHLYKAFAQTIAYPLTSYTEPIPPDSLSSLIFCLIPNII